jgi:hypothetical protein
MTPEKKDAVKYGSLPRRWTDAGWHAFGGFRVGAGVFIEGMNPISQAIIYTNLFEAEKYDPRHRLGHHFEKPSKSLRRIDPGG